MAHDIDCWLGRVVELPTAMARYCCLNRPLLRGAPEMKPKKTGTLKKGQLVEVLEEQRLENGVLRLRTAEGWGSERQLTAR